MAKNHALMLAMTIFIWGINFLFMKWSLNELPPLIVGMLRFILLIFPAIFFLKKPNTSWKWLILYGLFMNFGQFSLMFWAVSLQFPTGLTALVAQAQVFLTVLFASLMLHEPVKANQIIGMINAGIGLLLIGVGQYQGNSPLVGIFPLLGSAVLTAFGNIIVKKIGNVDALSLVIWGGLSSLIAFTLSSFALYGVAGVVEHIGHLTWRGVVGLLFLSYISSLIGYAVWGFLLVRYSASQVTPFALIIPVIALLIGFIFLDEKLGVWHWFGIITVMLGLLIQMFGEKFVKNMLK